MVEEYSFSDFRILSEPWNRYRLADGTVLKIKFTLLKVKVIKTGEGKARAEIRQNNAIVIEAPAALLGPPGREYSLEEISASIVDPDLGFETLDRGPFAYLLADGQFLFGEIVVRTVGKSSLFGPDGEPKYRVDFLTSVNIISPPKTSNTEHS